jgi:hypothetical protein
VGLGREEYLLLTIGAGHLRDGLITVMRAEAGSLGEGALHLSRSISSDDMALLESLPSAFPEREGAIAAQLALARAFMPRAQAFCAEQGVDWPAAFEAATRTHLARALAMDPSALW